MSTRQFLSIFFIILGVCILTMIFSFTSFDVLEVDIPFKWTIKYFSLPILVLTLPSCSFIYLAFLHNKERNKYNSKIWDNLRTIFRIITLTIALTGILGGTTLSTIILTNAYLGNNKEINLQAKIVDYYTLTNNGGKVKHYIKIQDKQLDKIVDLRVEQPYQVGQTFNKTMKIGKWGLLYSTKKNWL